jgi:prevent-host-death family protein
MRIAPLADIKAKFSSYLKATEDGPVVVTRNGKAVAVLLSVTNDDDVERLVLAHSAKFQALLDVGRQQIREGKGIPHDQFWAEVKSRAKTRATRK